MPGLREEWVIYLILDALYHATAAYMARKVAKLMSLPQFDLLIWTCVGCKPHH